MIYTVKKLQKSATYSDLNEIHKYLSELGFKQLNGTDESLSRSFGSEDLGTVILEHFLNDKCLEVAVGTRNEGFLEVFTKRFYLK